MNYITIPGLKFRQTLKRTEAENLMDIVCNYFDIKITDLLGRRRFRIFVVARHIVFKILRVEHGMQLAEIGRLFDRDHTTVIHGLLAIKDLIDGGDEFVIKSFSDIKGLLK